MDLWLNRLELVSLDDKNAILVIDENQDLIDILNTNYSKQIADAFAKALSMNINVKIYKKGHYLVKGSEEEKMYIQKQEEADKGLLPDTPEKSDGFYFDKGDGRARDDEYTFENFIVGSSNKFAYAASVSVANHPAVEYNPLFIYGASGLGKTHLMRAIAHDVSSRHPDFKIIFVSAENFTNEFLDCLVKKSTSKFKEKYRSADMLFVDDIQFIAGKESTQEEFFHTFNTLYESKRQIVLTSDRSPKEMQLLDDRLQTRFEWGLLVDVQPPDFETRLAIVKNKAAQWGSVIDDDIAKYIAENVSSNVRQLEGAMNKILAYRDLIGKEMDEESANRAVRDMLRKSNEYIPTAASIIDEVSRFFGIDEAVVKGPSRSREAVTARQAAMYLVRRMTNLSTPDIGREFGGRDHTTVLHALEQVETKLQNDPGFAQTIKDITININSKK